MFLTALKVIGATALSGFTLGAIWVLMEAAYNLRQSLKEERAEKRDRICRNGR